METEFEDKRFADFSPTPVDPQNIVLVSRILPEGSKEPIGQICIDFSDGPTFLCLDAYGEELFSPTSDYAEAESRFERYAKRLTQEALAKERKVRTPVQDDKAEEMESVRIRKGRNQKSKTISI